MRLLPLIFILCLSTVLVAQTSPEKTLQTRQPNYIRDTSRPVSEIAADYPFDIPLRTADDQVVLSSEVLPQNGKPTILLFWLTTCFPCRMELQALEKEVPHWREEVDFNLVAISTDFAKNFPAFVQRVEDRKWSWPAYNDKDREFRKVMPGGLNGLPQTFVLNAKGEIVYHKRKYRPGDEKALFAAVREAARR